MGDKKGRGKGKRQGKGKGKYKSRSNRYEVDGDVEGDECMPRVETDQDDGYDRRLRSYDSRSRSGS